MPNEEKLAISSVWLAFSGEYEQRGPFAAFTTEELAKANSDDIEEIKVFARPIKTGLHHSRWVRVMLDGSVEIEHEPRTESEWPEWIDGWDEPVSEAKVLDYRKYGPSVLARHPFWVTVEGADETAVEAALLEGIEEARRQLRQPPERDGAGLRMTDDDWEAWCQECVLP